MLWQIHGPFLVELVHSMKQDGIRRPIRIDRNERRVIDGHHRIAAALNLGLESVPVADGYDGTDWAEAQTFVFTEAREKVEPELQELFDLGVKGAGAMVIVGAARSLVAAVRAEERNRVTVEQLRDLRVYAYGNERYYFLTEEQVQAVHRLYSGEATDGR